MRISQPVPVPNLDHETSLCLRCGAEDHHVRGRQRRQRPEKIARHGGDHTRDTLSDAHGYQVPPRAAVERCQHEEETTREVAGFPPFIMIRGL